MNLRKALLEDKEDISEIIGVLRIDIPDFVWDTDEFIARQIKKGEYFLAELGKEIVGIISFRQRDKKMYIETIAVKKNYQMEGVGARLIGFAKQFTKGKGLDFLCACSFYEYKTVDFYLNQGFNLLNGSGVYSQHKYYRFEMKI